MPRLQMSLRDTLYIPRKSERPQSPEEAGNLFTFTKEAGFGNLPFRRAGGLASWRGELLHRGLVLLPFGESHLTQDSRKYEGCVD